ncbi:MAG: hypothetical protein Q4F69_02565 [Bacteroidia bacterium]|nr:hypothetical protein [Bacteroidia bacterium]
MRETSSYPKRMTIIRDCHWSNNTVVNVENRIVERFLRLWVRGMGWHLANMPKRAAAQTKETGASPRKRQVNSSKKGGAE